MRKESLGLLPLVLLVAAVLPIPADSAPQPDCFNPTTSLASTVRGPTAGDENFFTLPVGPSNIMFILDSSGSMVDLPQCQNGWGGSGSLPCPYPLNSADTTPDRAKFPAHGSGADIVGTCDVAGDTRLSWMLDYVPDASAGVYDPGHATTSDGLTDAPTWGSTCSGDNCLFRSDRVYHYRVWGQTSARSYGTCAFIDVDDVDDDDDEEEPRTSYPTSAAVTAAEAACQACLSTKGFYFMQAKDSSGNLQNQIVFSGAWLNKNPPKYMAARKVIKDMIWMDPDHPSALDSVRFGLSILAPVSCNWQNCDTGNARIIVPLGPDKPSTYPRNTTKFVEARQYMVNALNRSIANLPSYISGSTPLATTLFGIGQYFSSDNTYTGEFGASFEVTSLDEGTAGAANAPWAQSNSNQCSICWGCQQNSVILVTDGAPNNDDELPSDFDTYDDTVYHASINCGPGTSCSSGGEPATCPTAQPQNAQNVNATRKTASEVGTPVICSRNSQGRLRCGGSGSTTCPTEGAVCGYRCPGDGTIRGGSYQCSGYYCPGSTTPQSHSTPACYSTCPGDPTQYPRNHVCWVTCPNDSTHYPIGHTCSPCACLNDPNDYTPGHICAESMCCSPDDDEDNPPNPLPRVASWLHTNDLRSDFSSPDKQIISTYTVSFGLPVPPSPEVNPAIQILKAAANMGGGIFNNASDARSLSSAVSSAVQNVVSRANSFSAPAAASLSTLRSVAVEAVLTRFKPNDTPIWEGHVYQGMLFDEFLNGCDGTKGPQAAQQPQVRCGGKVVSANFDGNATSSGTADCSGVFLVDADCDEVVEDITTGAFLKKGQGTTPANMFWDAGFVLSNPTYPAGHSKAGQAVPGYRSADARTVYSVVNGAMTALTTANASTFAPYMSLDTAWCTQRLQLWGICGASPLTACSNVPNQCAAAVINFVRGWDVTDNDGDGCGAPGRQSNSASCPGGADGEQRDRANDNRTASPIFWKLGDVFHSAPVIVRPPIDESSCSTGFENQCSATIFSPHALPKQTQITSYAGQGLNSTDADAYEVYRLANRDRRQVVLVGSNDGMLHAFDAGSPDTSQQRNALGLRPYTKGTGEELWAFVPPDLLPRLKDLTQSHQYMVDGDVMAKDIWVDGTTADPAVDNTRDNVKQYASGHEEFHTVAVITERGGGTQYTALDITDVENPKFLWVFPPPGSEDAGYMGQSWTSFAPGPPPIGPVRRALDGDPDPTNRNFREQWIVFINGGYDPTLTRGRAVWMVDAWTGQVVWRFTDNDFKELVTDGAANQSMFPVTGTVDAVDIGDTTQPVMDRDGFYDTATWGDLGGNLFVARFWSPGEIDGSTHRVNNWFAARAFEQRRATAQNITGRSPFFFKPDDVFDSATHTLHTFLGSGNRERSMSAGNECTPDNLLGCCLAGCASVEATFTDTFGTCTRGATFSCTSGALELTPTSSSNCSAPLACGAFSTTASIRLECPGPSTINLTATMTCDSSGICTAPTNLGTGNVGTMPAASTKSRFYGVWSFGGSSGKRFETEAEAKAFDANRFTDVDISESCAGPTGGSCKLIDVTRAVVTFNPASPLLSSVSCPANTTCQATSADAGWFYEYGTMCPLSSCDPAPPWYDEKTGSAASTMLGCASWGSFRPVGAQASGTDPCTGDVGTPQSYSYMADYLTGVPSATCGYRYSSSSTNQYVRATQRNTVSAPNAQTLRVVVSPAGEVRYLGVEFPPGSGSSGMVTQTSYGTRTDTAETMYWLEVPRELHDCRHNATATATSCQ